MRYQVLLSGGVFDFQTRTIVLPANAEWQEYRAWLTAGNTPLPPDTIGQDDLATAKTKRISEIDAYAAGLRNLVVRGRSAGEMSSWPVKLLESRAWLATADPLQSPTLVLTAQIRGITVTELANRVLGLAEPFLQIEATIDGIRGRHNDVVDACTTVAEIITYDWHSGWPNLGQ